MENVSQITYPEEITKRFQVNKIELESFLKNYKYNALDGTQLMKNQNMAAPQITKQSLQKQPKNQIIAQQITKQSPQNQPKIIAQQITKQPLRKRSVVGGKKKTRRKHRTRRHRYVRDTFFS